MTKLEEVARAILATGMVQNLSFPDDYVKLARAALTAMREPSEGMKKCSDEVHWGYSCNICGGLQEGWYAMIDAALSGEG